jgi:ubiquinone/menaquinone biosynthesis C-methylase UbiE
MTTDVNALRAKLDSINEISTEQWIDSLTPRGIAELEFHNRKRDRSFEEQTLDQDTYEKFYGNRKYYSATKRSHDYIENWIKRMAPGAVVLDYACGYGGLTRLAAKAGAKLAIGLDISDVSVRNAREAAKEEGVEANTYFVQANAENTRLPDECVDVAICSGMLHHLDLSYAFPELRRLLKVGGRVLAAEALDYNPAIKFYRYLTPQMRTEWEKAHILSHSDLKFAKRFFDIGEVRYWHVVGYVGGKFPPLLPTLDGLDRILERVPLLQLMAWIWTFELIRPPKS